MIVKIEIPTGTEFVLGYQKVRCVSADNRTCKGCIFASRGYDYTCDVQNNAGKELYFACHQFDRSDKKDVIFQEIEEYNIR